jgi:hypothetical protein
MTDEQFQKEMAGRVAADPHRDVYPGCPLCGAVAKQAPKTPPKPTEGQQ